MMLTTDDLDEIEYQLTRKDKEAIILFRYINQLDKLSETCVTEHEFNKCKSELIKETKNKLNIFTNQELYHKLDIITGICHDDEREWREKKYGKQ